jgi:hypothetical protein
MKASKTTTYALTLNKEEKKVLINLMDFASKIFEDSLRWDMACSIKTQLENKRFAYTLYFVSFERSIFLKIIEAIAAHPQAPSFAKAFEQDVCEVLNA